jgi:hypothetical protein
MAWFVMTTSLHLNHEHAKACTGKHLPASESRIQSLMRTSLSGFTVALSFQSQYVWRSLKTQNFDNNPADQTSVSVKAAPLVESGCPGYYGSPWLLDTPVYEVPFAKHVAGISIIAL